MQPLCHKKAHRRKKVLSGTNAADPVQKDRIRNLDPSPIKSRSPVFYDTVSSTNMHLRTLSLSTALSSNSSSEMSQTGGRWYIWMAVP